MARVRSLYKDGSGREPWSKQRPALISLFMEASFGECTARHALRLIVKALGEKLAGSKIPLRAAKHRVMIPNVDPCPLRPVHNEYNRLRWMFTNIIKYLPSRDPITRILLMIDDLHRLEPSTDTPALDWLPQIFPDEMRCILSCPPSPMLDLLLSSSPKVEVLRLERMPIFHRKELVKHTLSQAELFLSMEQQDMLVSLGDGGVPGFLQLAIAEILGSCGGGIASSLPVIYSLPASTEDICFHILQRLEHNFGEFLIERTMSFLDVSRGGLFPSELREVLGDNFEGNDGFYSARNDDGSSSRGGSRPQSAVTSMSRGSKSSKASLSKSGVDFGASGRVPESGLAFSVWAPLEMALRPLLLPCSELQQVHCTLWSVGLRSAVYKRYELADKGEEFHRELGSLFLAKADPENHRTWRGIDTYRACGNLAYHTLYAKMWDDLREILSDLTFLELCVSRGLLFSLLDDYSAALRAVGFESEHSDLRQILLHFHRFL